MPSIPASFTHHRRNSPVTPVTAMPNTSYKKTCLRETTLSPSSAVFPPRTKPVRGTTRSYLFRVSGGCFKERENRQSLTPGTAFLCVPPVADGLMRWLGCLGFHRCFGSFPILLMAHIWTKAPNGRHRERCRLQLQQARPGHIPEITASVSCHSAWSSMVV